MKKVYRTIFRGNSVRNYFFRKVISHLLGVYLRNVDEGKMKFIIEKFELTQIISVPDLSSDRIGDRLKIFHHLL